ncbi:MAG TPA: RNA polymerase sigma factor SigM [Actinomycetes bacterium]|nr:RNA polymerase sigma factor SigM [Actinomycetes bacterium]
MTGPEVTDPDDRALLARHVSGDASAFSELVRRHRDRLWSVALRTTGNPEDAADALQEALISAYRGAGSYRGEAAVTTWLHRIVVNAGLDVLRRRAARPSVPLPEAEDRVADPRDRLAERETSLVVLEALRALPPEQRAALVLVDLEGHSVEEAARILDCAPGTVKSRCSRGRARLAPLLQPLLGGDRHTLGGNAEASPSVPPVQPHDEALGGERP